MTTFTFLILAVLVANYYAAQPCLNQIFKCRNLMEGSVQKSLPDWKSRCNLYSKSVRCFQNMACPPSVMNEVREGDNNIEAIEDACEEDCLPKFEFCLSKLNNSRRGGPLYCNAIHDAVDCIETVRCPKSMMGVIIKVFKNLTDYSTICNIGGDPGGICYVPKCWKPEDQPCLEIRCMDKMKDDCDDPAVWNKFTDVLSFGWDYKANEEKCQRLSEGKGVSAGHPTGGSSSMCMMLLPTLMLMSG